MLHCCLTAGVAPARAERTGGGAFVAVWPEASGAVRTEARAAGWPGTATAARQPPEMNTALAAARQAFPSLSGFLMKSDGSPRNGIPPDECRVSRWTRVVAG